MMVRRTDRTPPQLLGRWGLVAVGVLLAGIVALLGWHFVESRSRISRMMAERSETLTGMVATEVRNVARFGKARLERVDLVLEELAESPDIKGVRLVREDGAVAITHGALSDESPNADAGTTLVGSTLFCTKTFRIETQHCGRCHSCECDLSAGVELDGTYRVTLAVDATPYQALERAVWVQGGVGAALVLLLIVALWLLRRQAVSAAQMGRALAVAEERGRSSERLGLLAGGLAHEIKNPVGSLRGFAQLIVEHAGTASKVEEYAEVMVAELDGLTRRVDRLRDLARPDPPRFENGRPGQVVRRVVSLLKPDARARDVTFDLDVPADDGPEIAMDRERLRDLVVNLIMNALEASPEGGVVRIGVRAGAAEGGALIEIDDDGPGIEKEERDRALRPFHTTKATGLGLGLTVAQQAAEDHGGTLELGEGARGGLSVRVQLWRKGPPHGP